MAATTPAVPEAANPVASTDAALPVLLGATAHGDGAPVGDARHHKATGDFEQKAHGSSLLRAASKDSILRRASSGLERAGSQLQRASSNLTLQRANSLPKEDKDLRHAATMPMMFDVEADRPWCWGLWKTQQLVGFLLGVGLLATLCAARPVKSYPAANDMLGVTALCAAFWVFEVIPLYMTALFPLVLLPFLKVTTSEIVAQAYWHWISLLVFCTYLVDIALEECHLPKRLALKLLLNVGVVSPAAMLASFMVLSWFMSMVCNNIAVTLLVTPFAISLLNAAEEQVRNAVASAAADAVEEGLAQAADAEAAGAQVVGHQVSNGSRDSSRSARRRLRDERAARESDREADEVQKLGKGVLLGIAYAASAGGIATLTGTVSHYYVVVQDIINSQLAWGPWFLFAFPISLTCVVVCYIGLYLRYVRGLKFRGIDKEVLEAEYEDLLAEVGPICRDELVVGAAQALQILLLIIRPYAISPFIETRYGMHLVNDATVACIPALLLFFVPSTRIPGRALLSWPAVHEKFDFGLLLLIGGGLAISSGFTQSGLNIAMGDAIATLIPHVPNVVLDLVVVLCITLSSQIFSGIGTAAAITPVLCAAAMESVVNPLALVLPATVATSFVFLLPTATPPNVVVLAKSQDLAHPLRIRDYFSNGLPLTVVLVVVGALLAHTLGMVVFDAQAPFPEWACQAIPATCNWVAVPGLVQGREVFAQACISLVAESDGAMCRLWNGTLLSTAAYSMGI